MDIFPHKMFSFLLGVHLGVEFLDHLVTLSVAFFELPIYLPWLHHSLQSGTIQKGYQFLGWGCIFVEDEKLWSQSKEPRETSQDTEGGPATSWCDVGQEGQRS